MVGEAFGLPLDTGGGGGTSSLVVAGSEVTATAAPHTVYVNGEHAIYDPVTNRTFIAYLGLNRDLYVTYWDHQGLEAATPVLVDAATIAASDAHGAPTLCLDALGHLQIVWSSHRSAHRHCRSTNPRDISAWTNQALTTEGTYPHIDLDPPTGDLYVIDRVGTPGSVGGAFPSQSFAGIRRSTDDGVTWAAPTALVDTRGVDGSPSCDVNGTMLGPDGRIHFIWTIANMGTAVRSNVYHAAYDPSDGHVYTAGGTDLGTTVDPADHAACQAGTATNLIAATVYVADDGTILISYGLLNGTTDVTNRIAVWDGSTWTDGATGITQPPTSGLAMAYSTRGAYRGLFTTLEAGIGNLVLYGSDTGLPTSWERIGTVLAGDSGEGYARVGPVAGGGPSVALTMQEPTGNAVTSATAPDLIPLTLITDPTIGIGTAADMVTLSDALPIEDGTGTAGTSEQAARGDHVHPLGSGRWEVVMTGSGASLEPVANSDETDWLYTWVED